MKKIVCVLLGMICALLALNMDVKESEVGFAEEVSGMSSTSYVLLDKNSGEILLEKNATQKLPVASICKLMTTLITLEQIEEGKLNLDDMIVASEHACSMEGSQAFLDAGSEYSVRELLKSVIVASANDSAVVLAEAIGGSENNFVKLMNERAKQLGMTNTLYSNSTGLPAANQYSTAIDTAKILKEISQYQTYREDCKIWMDQFVHPSGRSTELVNTNRLIKYYEPCICGKTGFTDEAGYCLSASASKNDMDLIAVTLKCKDSASRFRECMQLLEYGFNHYENAEVINENTEVVNNIKVIGGEKQTISLKYEKSFSVLNKKGDNKSITTEIKLPEEIKAEVNEGDIIGEIVILKDGVVIGSVNIVASENVYKHNFRDIIDKIGNEWLIA